MDSKAKKVLDHLKNSASPMRPGDIATALGMEKDEVSKVIEQLKKEGLVISPKRCFYAPA